MAEGNKYADPDPPTLPVLFLNTKYMPSSPYLGPTFRHISTVHQVPDG